MASEIETIYNKHYLNYHPSNCRVEGHAKKYFVEFAEEKTRLIEFGRYDDSNVLIDTYSICILGTRKPTIEEAMEFCEKDMKEFGYESITDIIEIDYEEAHNFFDMENEDSLPVFE